MNISAVGSAAGFPASVTRPSSSYNAGWQQLTAGDWDLLSAPAGKAVGPKAPGLKPGEAPLVPLIASDMVNARRNGTVAPGQDFSPEFFHAQLAGQPAELREQLQRAIAYATQRDAAQTSPPKGRFDLLVDLYG
ncbi:MAG TPA: hypothetical protein VNS09_01090 [Solirubrobacter sp.]|nr:hypothetical protein [Solirubrobacter sp.]